MPASPSHPPGHPAGPPRATGPAGEGERFLERYGRLRHAVRAELEAAGLGAEAAERLVGSVFVRLAAEVEREQPPGSTLRSIGTLARRLSAPHLGTAHRGPGAPRVSGG